jgi:hypothetical protein
MPNERTDTAVAGVFRLSRDGRFLAKPGEQRIITGVWYMDVSDWPVSERGGVMLVGRDHKVWVPVDKIDRIYPLAE